MRKGRSVVSVHGRVLLFVAMLFAACTSASEENSPKKREALQLKVMEFNIEYGGHEIDFDSVVEAIQKSDADVVAVEEAWGNIPLLARRLGWRYFDRRMQLVSQLPLLAPRGSDGLYTFVNVEPGGVVAIGNVHLPAAPYGPFQIKDGAGPKEIIALEKRVRLPAVEPYLEALTELADDGIPVFLTGDFNAPSHLDWTTDGVGTRKHMEYALEWPVSAAVEEAGFKDSYREVHPDPVRSPGLTWPAARPFVEGYNPGLNGAAADRIDFVYSGGPAVVLDSLLVGEKSHPEVEIPITPWPTDHRGILSTFEIEPGMPPAFIAVEQRLIEVGDKGHISFGAPDVGADRVVLVPQGDELSAAVDDISVDDDSQGTATFTTQDWKPGPYEAVLIAATNDELSRISFWVTAPDARPRIATRKPIYGVGEGIDVQWRNTPANRWDWVGIYKRGADPNVASYITWFYTNSSVAGSKLMDEAAAGRWPLRPGKYSAYLLEDDSYNALARADFTVR